MDERPGVWAVGLSNHERSPRLVGRGVLESNPIPNNPEHHASRRSHTPRTVVAHPLRLMTQPQSTQRQRPQQRLQPQLTPGWMLAIGQWYLRRRGWRLRGMLPTQFWRCLVVLWAPSPWHRRTMTWIFSTRLVKLPAFEDHAAVTDIMDKAFSQGKTCLVMYEGRKEQLLSALDTAQTMNCKICLAAWEDKRKFVHIHAPFKPSDFQDRDAHYMSRYFRYFTGRKN